MPTQFLVYRKLKVISSEEKKHKLVCEISKTEETT